MEEEKTEPERKSSTPTDRMFFEQPASLSNSDGGKKLLIPIILIILLLVGISGWFFIKGRGAQPSPTPTTTLPIIEETSAPSPTPSVERSTIDIEILNGTGISGEAAFLEDALKKLGYTSIKTGNAQNQDNTQTQVSFSSSVPEEIKTEIQQELERIYKDVKVGQTLTSSQLDVRVITGLRKGATPKPTATATPKTTGSPSPSPVKSPSPSPSPGG